MSEIDRLIRETNPEPGEPRGFEPQHGKSDGTFVRTSEDDPLPTKDPEIKAEIESLKAEVVAIKEGTSDVSDSEAQTRLQGILDKLDTVLSVSDSNVKSEMETLNTEISDIKDKLDAVIEDGAVKSQVTGSNVKRTVYTDTVTLAPDEETTLIENQDFSNGKTIYWTLSGRTNRSGLRIRVVYSRESGDFSSARDVFREDLTAENDKLEDLQSSLAVNINKALSFKPHGDYMQITVTNEESSDTTFRNFCLSEYIR